MARDVGDWLGTLGLTHYAGAFAENGIDLDLLPELTNEDLKDLGIVRLADRKRILKAMVGLKPAGMPGHVTAPATSATPGREAERRQLTVMFCDLVDST